MYNIYIYIYSFRKEKLPQIHLSFELSQIVPKLTD